MSDLKIYFWGVGDDLVKIGKTTDPLPVRKASLMQGQLTGKVNLHLLAAVRAMAASSETALVGRNGTGGFFDHIRANVNSTETFRAEPELIEYINWLRQQRWTWHDEINGPDDVPDFELWRPTSDRRIEVQEPDPDGQYDRLLIAEYDDGPLVGTPWEALSMPKPRYNDYYTPPSYIECASKGMGGLDLDAASSWTANRVHQIPTYYHAYRSAFQNRWFGRVWLNPPYGSNGQWYREALKYLKSGDISQICIFGQVSTFVTKHARPLQEFPHSFILFSPTPTFWGCNKEGKLLPPEACEVDGQRRDSKFGTDLPHGILYIGNRHNEIAEAFRDKGYAYKVVMRGGDCI